MNLRQASSGRERARFGAPERTRLGGRGGAPSLEGAQRRGQVTRSGNVNPYVAGPGYLETGIHPVGDSKARANGCGCNRCVASRLARKHGGDAAAVRQQPAGARERSPGSPGAGCRRPLVALEAMNAGEGSGARRIATRGLKPGASRADWTVAK